MQTKQANRRVQQVQRILEVNEPDLTLPPSTGRKRIITLGDNLDVFISEPTTDDEIFISIGPHDVLGSRSLSRTAGLVLSALGTPFEKDNPVPKYPVLELSAARQEACSPTVSKSDLWACIYALWTLHHSQENIPIILAPSFLDVDELKSYLLSSGLARTAADTSENVLFLLRGTFWQGAGTGPFWDNHRGWLRYSTEYALYPHVQTFTRSPIVIAQHPLRPPKPPKGTLVYRRFCAEIGKVLEFRVLDPEDLVDLHTFHNWMNDDRVNSGWGEQGDLERHRAYIEGALDEPSVMPLMMSWNGERMGYCEVVWIKENHVAPYIPSGAQDFDQGLHVLVGENKFRGYAYSQAWFRSIQHYIFLSDPRTERVIGEPRLSNAAIMRTVRDAGMHLETSFYFPYKYSALTICLRERFYKEDMLL